MRITHRLLRFSKSFERLLVEDCVLHLGKALLVALPDRDLSCPKRGGMTRRGLFVLITAAEVTPVELNALLPDSSGFFLCWWRVLDADDAGCGRLAAATGAS